MQNLMPTINTPDNVFHDGNPATGELGTIVSALWLNNTQSAVRDIQAECHTILKANGFTPDSSRQNQLWEAIQKAITNKVPSASTSHSGLVQLSSAVNSDSETTAATSKAVKTAYDLAAGKYTAENATTSKRGLVQLSSATDSTSETLAATPKAVKTVHDLAASKAPVNSPALTGHPTAPTPVDSAAGQEIATAAFVVAKIAKLVNSSPAALDTLQELAAALGNDPNFSATVMNLIGRKLSKDQNGADIPNIHAFVANIGACRAQSAQLSTGGGTWSTAQFIQWLKSAGAFKHPYWMCKTSWGYAVNKVITDTGCGNICLAGVVIEVMGTDSAMTIRITTPTTTSGGGVPNAQFTYINHGESYDPGWRRDYNSKNPPPQNSVVTDVKLGAEYSRGYAGGGVVKANPGSVLTGLQESAGDNEIHGYYFKPIQILKNDSWITIAG